MEDSSDLQLVRICFEATVARLETTGCESVAMSGIRVAGALIGKFPGFIATLLPVDFQRLIDGYDLSGETHELTVDRVN